MQLDNRVQGPNCLSYQAVKQQDVRGMINMCELLGYTHDRRCCSWASNKLLSRPLLPAMS